MDKKTVAEIVDQMTVKGIETMRSIGRLEVSYFDEGVTEHSGIWGSCLTQEMGHKSSGVINRLRDLGLFQTSPGQDGDDSDWWALTALGADVAKFLANKDHTPVAYQTPAPTYSKTVGRKWTYIYLGEELVMEIQTKCSSLVPNFDNIPNR